MTVMQTCAIHGMCISIQSQPCVNACRLTPMCIIEGMLCKFCVTLHRHNHMHGEPTWSSVAGNTSHTSAHSLRADSAHLHRTISPSASDTADDAQIQWLINYKCVHHKCVYLIDTKSYKLLSGCDLLWPSIFNPESMTGEAITSCLKQHFGPPGQGSIFNWLGQVGVNPVIIATSHLSFTMGYSVISPHPVIERTVTLMTDSLYLLLLKPKCSIYAEAASHPTNTISMPHLWGPIRPNSCLCSTTGEVITGCHKYHFGPPGQGSFLLNIAGLHNIQWLLPHIT